MSDEMVKAVEIALMEHWQFMDRCRCGWVPEGLAVVAEFRHHLATAAVEAMRTVARP